MFGLVQPAVQRIATSVVDPVVNRILKLSWTLRLLILLGITLLTSAAVAPQRAVLLATSGTRLVRVALAPTDALVLADAERESLEHATGDLTGFLASQLRFRGTPEVNEWTVGQIAVAVGGLRGVPVDTARLIAKFLHQGAKGDCSCWREYRTEQPHIVATAWVLMGLAELNSPPTQRELDFLLEQQHKQGGWWSLYPSNGDETNASTYATAMSLLSLQSLLEKDLIPPADLTRTKLALNSGMTWLRRERIANSARWEDYPNAEDGKVSLSLSGLVVHLLHRGDEKHDRSIEREWLGSLPEQVPTATDFDISGRAVVLASGDHSKDDARMYILEWMMVATRDAYHSGTLRQRAAASDWIARAVARTHADEQTLYSSPWIAAEFVYALRYLQHSDPDGTRHDLSSDGVATKPPLSRR